MNKPFDSESTPALLSPEALFVQRADVRIVDCRFSLADFDAGRTSFNEGHIEGAVHWDMETDLAGPKTGTNGRHPLPSQESVESLLRRSGISANQRVVLYDDNRLAGVARAWWLLTHFGLKNIAILNGGLAGWRAAGFTVSNDVVEPIPSSVELKKPDPSRVVSMSAVLAQSLLIDAREKPRYLGEQEPIDPVAGRIPGALNRVWTDTTDKDGKLIDIANQRHQWQALVGTQENPVMYCGSGITASVNALSWQLSGLGVARLYTGSFSEWCAFPDNPVATGNPA